MADSSVDVVDLCGRKSYLFSDMMEWCAEKSVKIL